MSKTNCPNCGAPRTGMECEYCGTKFPPELTRYIFDARAAIGGFGGGGGAGGVGYMWCVGGGGRDGWSTSGGAGGNGYSGTVEIQIGAQNEK